MEPRPPSYPRRREKTVLYRDLHDAADRMGQIREPLHRAILAESVREMTEGAGQAERAANEMRGRLQMALRTNTDTFETDAAAGRGERVLAQAAVTALEQAVNEARRSLTGNDLTSIRAGLLDCMTQEDAADAYLRAAIGEELGLQ